jgi:hypothetical protein
MSRRRYLSTDISLDPAVNRVARRSEFAALLYTWMIPHAREDATITGNPERLLLEVMPGRRDKEATDIEEALEIIESEGLFEMWSRVTNTIYFPLESFYRYQTIVQKQNRRTAPAITIEQQRTAANSSDQQQTPENATSLSLSLTPSLSPSHSKDKTLSFEGVEDSVIGYWMDKACRDPKPADLRSLRILSKSYGPNVLTTAIGQAVMQGDSADNYALITTIAKAEVSS